MSLGFLLGLDDTESRRAIARDQRQVGSELARTGHRQVGAATARTGVNPVAAARASAEAQRGAMNQAASQAQQALLAQREADRNRAMQTIGGLFQTAGSVAGMLIPGAGPAVAPMTGQLAGGLAKSVGGAAMGQTEAPQAQVPQAQPMQMPSWLNPQQPAHPQQAMTPQPAQNPAPQSQAGYGPAIQQHALPPTQASMMGQVGQPAQQHLPNLQGPDFLRMLMGLGGTYHR